MDLNALREGSSIPCNQITEQENLPVWLNKDRFKRGQQFYKRHMSVCFLAMHYSLIVGFSIASLIEALVFTGLSNTASTSIKRYLDTALHIYLWHTGDVWDDKEDAAYKSIRNVRNMHFRAAGNMKRKNSFSTIDSSNGDSDRKSEQKQEDTSRRIYFSQYDMALVQVGFMGAITMYPTRFGFSPTKDQLEDYIHFWRGIGHILGVQDEYNICQGNYEETFNICKEIEEHVLIPSLKSPPPNFELMSDAYCEGVNALFGVPIYSTEAVIAFVLGNMGRQTLRPLSWKNWLRCCFYKLQILCFQWVPYLEWFLSQRAERNFSAVAKLTAPARNKIMSKLTERIEKSEKKRK